MSKCRNESLVFTVHLITVTKYRKMYILRLYWKGRFCNKGEGGFSISKRANLVKDVFGFEATFLTTINHTHICNVFWRDWRHFDGVTTNFKSFSLLEREITRGQARSGEVARGRARSREVTRGHARSREVTRGHARSREVTKPSFHGLQSLSKLFFLFVI